MLDNMMRRKPKNPSHPNVVTGRKGSQVKQYSESIDREILGMSRKLDQR